jgi:DNA polymerase IV
VLARALWPLCERGSARLKQASVAGRTITLKLKTADFRSRRRSHWPADPTQLAEASFRTAAALLTSEAHGITRFRLIGVGADALVEDLAANPPTLFDRELDRPRRIEHAMDQIRTRLRDESVRFGGDLSAPRTTTLRRSKGS